MISIVETKRFPDKLVTAIENLISEGICTTLSETDKNVFIRLTDSQSALQIRTELLNSTLPFLLEDEGGSIGADQNLNQDYAPFSFNIEKPKGDDGSVFVLHVSSFIKIFKNYQPRILRIGVNTSQFITYSSAVCSWDDQIEFTPEHFAAEPKRFVRDLSTSNLVPADLSSWFLKDSGNAPHGDPVFETWKLHAASIYLRTLCTEIEPDGTLLFRGQPIVRINGLGETLSTSCFSFNELHSLVEWVYENKREAETRHGFVVAEIVRTSLGAETSNDLCDKGFRSFLDSARNAYQFSLHQISRDALQSLAELRKSVGDETSKTADFVKQITTSVSGALFVAAGILAARLTLVKETQAFNIIALISGLIIFVYVTVTAVTGWRFLSIQHNLRFKWKDRTHKYLSTEEYRELVEDPTKSAERAYNWTATVSVITAFMVFSALSYLSYPDEITSIWRWICNEIQLISKSTLEFLKLIFAPEPVI